MHNESMMLKYNEDDANLGTPIVQTQQFLLRFFVGMNSGVSKFIEMKRLRILRVKLKSCLLLLKTRMYI